MNVLPRIARRLRALLRKATLERDMADEMRFHLEQRAAEYTADGLSDEDARYAAQRRFGHVGSLQEQARDVRGWGGLERCLKDLGLAARQLLRSPGFTLLAVTTLALGIGANTAMYSVLNTVLLKPLPYPAPEQLSRLYRATPQDREGNISPADFRDLQRSRAAYGEFAAYAPEEVSLAEPGRPAEMNTAVQITPNFLSLLGTPLQLGRGFDAGEAGSGRDAVVILSQRAWRNRFGGDPHVVGRSIRIDGQPHAVVGVLPESFNDWRHLGWVDLFRPLALEDAAGDDRRSSRLRVIARRAPAVPAAEADGMIASFGAQLAASYPDVHAQASWRTVPLFNTTMGRDAPVVFSMLIGLSGFVLLIACSNLANLLLARTITRARELAMRSALGASRLQLLRPLIVEALLLALAGAGGAILVAQWAGHWLAVRSTGDNGEQVILALDWSVFSWAVAASLVTALAFGLAPALFALRLDVNEALKSGGRGVTGSLGHRRFRHALIVGQFALAMVLLAGAGLFIRGLHDLNHRRSGWDSSDLVTGTLLLSASTYDDDERLRAFYAQARERLAALPGVESTSLASAAPFFSWTDIRKLQVHGDERPERGREPAVRMNRVSPGYFETVGTRLLAGRTFTAQDTATSPPAFIVSQAAARALFGTADPVGRRLAEAEGDTVVWGEVVGVVSDVRAADAEPGGVLHQAYQPLLQSPHRHIELAVRTHGVAPAAVIDGIRTTMAALDPDLPVRRLMLADQRIARANYQLGVLRDMLTSFALLGLGLAALGIYGVIARTMAQRTAEFAIRLALGARITDLTRVVLGAGAKLALSGAAIGLAGAWALAQLLAGAFPGMQLSDPRILIAATLLLLLIALLACWLPARRAGKVDPMAVLRAE